MGGSRNNEGGDGWLGVSMGGWVIMGGWLNGWVKWVNGWVDLWIDGRMNSILVFLY